VSNILDNCKWPLAVPKSAIIRALVLLACIGRLGPTVGYSQEQPSSGSTSQNQTAAGTKAISILAWNVESGGSDPSVIARQLKDLGTHDVICLSEVDPGSFGLYAGALGPQFKSINGRTGNSDRLQIIYDAQKFELLQSDELNSYRDFTLNNGNHRSPLLARLAIRGTGTQFVVMVNHLARRNAELRRNQAIGLREWARDQSVPLVAIGDFNMDFDFRTKRGNDAFPEMIRDNVWTWVRPRQLVDTNWSDQNKDGLDDYPDSTLDFAFVAGAAKTWSPECEVVIREGDFPDSDQTSDHRPVRLILKL
jgi:endonuclease/exonuclease/phosphatase family metal-dependent hydrolase